MNGILNETNAKSFEVEVRVFGRPECGKVLKKQKFNLNYPILLYAKIKALLLAIRSHVTIFDQLVLSLNQKLSYSQTYSQSSTSSL